MTKGLIFFPQAPLLASTRLAPMSKLAQLTASQLAVRKVAVEPAMQAEQEPKEL